MHQIRVPSEPILDQSKDRSYAVNRLPNGHFYVRNLRNNPRVDESKQVARLKADNGKLKTMVDELTKKNEDSELKIEELEKANAELKKKQTKLTSDLDSLKSTDVNLVISQQELKECNEDLEASLRKYESVCPSWSEWSDCSKTCWGIQTRTDRCSMEDEQISSCNQDSSCARSGKNVK